MAKVQFPNRVDYKGTVYSAHIAFEVDDGDLDSLIKDGAIIIKSKPTRREKAEKLNKVPVKKEPAIKE